MNTKTRTQRIYDHRLKNLVYETGDIQHAIKQGVPNSTTRSWLNSPPKEVISIDVLDTTVTELQHEVLALRRRIEKLLAVLAQRLGKVFASSATWYRLIHEKGWRRPRLRVHPAKPKIGIRASRPNEYWHIDTTVIRLLDNTKAYIHAVIDNFSRKILAWKVSDRFEIGNTGSILLEAGKLVQPSSDPPTLMADSGVENVNSKVDEIIEPGLLKRVLAMTEINFSNSLIEAWWRALKHQWLYLNSLDSVNSPFSSANSIKPFSQTADKEKCCAPFHNFEKMLDFSAEDN